MLKVTIAPNPCSVSLKGKTIEEKDFVIKNEGDSDIWFRFGKMESVHSYFILPAANPCGCIYSRDFSTLRMIASRWKGYSSAFNNETVEDLTTVTVSLPVHFYNRYPGSEEFWVEGYIRCKDESLKPPVKTEQLVFEVSVPSESLECLEGLPLLSLRIIHKADRALLYSSDSSTDSAQLPPHGNLLMTDRLKVIERSLIQS
jgi:hypothetical protein